VETVEAEEFTAIRWSSFGVSGDLLTCLLFFIGIDKDDDVAIAGRPKKHMVEFAK
jgi:hypothetical protein